MRSLSRNRGGRFKLLLFASEASDAVDHRQQIYARQISGYEERAGRDWW